MNPLELFHEWIEGPEVALATATPAMKTYGMLLADNGSNWYVTGAPSPRWSNDELHALGGLTGSDFEVVDTSRLRP